MRSEKEASEMDTRWILTRRQLLKTMAASGALAAADLTWWEEPLVSPRRAWGATPVRFQFSVPEPKRTALVESLAQRFNQSQKDFEVKVEFVPQAQARQKLITGMAANNPPDCCQAWDNWVGEFEGMGAVEDLTARVKDWKYYSDVTPIAWQTVTVQGKILSFPWVVTNDGVYWRTDGWRGIVEGFGRGVTNMYIHNSGSSEEQKDFVGVKNFATVPLPVGPAKKRVSFYFSETLTGFKNAKNREGAWRFMSWLMDDEPKFMYCKTLGLLPARKTLAERPEFAKDPAYQGFIKSFPFSIVSPYLAYAGWGGKLDSEGVPLFQQALVGKLTAREFLEKFADMLGKNMA